VSLMKSTKYYILDPPVPHSMGRPVVSKFSSTSVVFSLKECLSAPKASAHGHWRCPHCSRQFCIALDRDGLSRFIRLHRDGGS